MRSLRALLPACIAAAQLVKRTELAQKLADTGWSPGLCYLTAQRS